MWIKFCAALALVLLGMASQYGLNQGEEEKIAEDAFIYGYPMSMAYKVIYDYAIDESSGAYKGPFNTIINETGVYTPLDTTVVTPNSDTPYSFVIMDLRSEPLILCVPDVDEERYYSVQLVSLYTYNFGYIGTRATGNKAGCYAVVGPHWKGNTPQGVDKVFYSETDLALAIYRTQIFGPDDRENVKKVQNGYKVATLSEFLNTEKPEKPPAVDWPKIDQARFEENPFTYLNFLLQFAPPIKTASVEMPMRERFASIGIRPHHPFVKLTDADRLGIKNGLEKIEKQAANFGTLHNGWRITKKGFGNRKTLKNDWLTRAAAAKAGIFGNDALEALYPIAVQDSQGAPLDGKLHSYTLTFEKDELPPVKAFWSVTLYDKKSQLLVANPINRYLINSEMVDSLKRNPDGSITLYIQNESPGKDREANWLPAPSSPFYLVMRLYLPKEEVLDGSWEPPPVKKVN